MPDRPPTQTTARTPERLTHYTRADAVDAHYRIAQAVCGAYIDPRKEFSAEPTCPACRQWREDYDALEIA